MRLRAPAIQVAYASTDELVVLADGRLLVLDPATGVTVERGPRVPGLTPLAMDPRATVVAVATDRAVALWNLTTHHLRLLPIPHNVNGIPTAVAFSPDGRRIAVANTTAATPAPPALVLLSTTSGRILARSGVGVQSGEAAVSATGLAFSPNGRELAVAEGSNVTQLGTVVLRNARTLGLERTLKSDVAEVATTVAFSADGTRVADSFLDGTGGVLSLTGQPIVSYPGVTSSVVQEAFSPDGRRVVESSLDGQVEVWRGAGLALNSTSIGGEPSTMTVAPDTTGFVTLLDTALGVRAQRWLADGRPAAPPLVVSRSSVVGQYFLSPEAEVVGVQPTTPRSPSRRQPIRIWSVAQRRVIRTTRAEPPASYEPRFSPDSATIALQNESPDGQISSEALLNTRTGREMTLFSVACGIPGQYGIAFDRSGADIAFASNCGEIRVWDQRVRRWAGRPISVNGQLDAVAISPDGRQIAAGETTGTIAVYDVATQRPIAALSDNTRSVYGLAYSPNGHYLASAGADGTIRISDAHTWHQLRVIQAPDAVLGLAFTPDSKTVYSWDATNTVTSWNACTDCENPRALLALARTRVTRSLTPEERSEFGLS